MDRFFQNGKIYHTIKNKIPTNLKYQFGFVGIFALNLCILATIIKLNFRFVDIFIRFAYTNLKSDIWNILYMKHVGGRLCHILKEQLLQS